MSLVGDAATLQAEGEASQESQPSQGSADHALSSQSLSRVVGGRCQAQKRMRTQVRQTTHIGCASADSPLIAGRDLIRGSPTLVAGECGRPTGAGGATLSRRKCKNLLARSLAGNVRRAHSPAAASSHGARTNNRLDRSSPVGQQEEEEKVDRRPTDDTRLSLQVPQRLLSGPSSTAPPTLVLARQRSHAPCRSGHLGHPRPSFLFDPTPSRHASFLPLPHHPPILPPLPSAFIHTYPSLLRFTSHSTSYTS